MTFYWLKLLTCCDMMFLSVSCSRRLAVLGVSFDVLSNCYSAKSCNFFDLGKRLDFLFAPRRFQQAMVPQMLKFTFTNV